MIQFIETGECEFYDDWFLLIGIGRNKTGRVGIERVGGWIRAEGQGLGFFKRSKLKIDCSVSSKVMWSKYLKR